MSTDSARTKSLPVRTLTNKECRFLPVHAVALTEREFTVPLRNHEIP
jgi:hypothetical protein